jgi:hypothetical protein
MRRKSIYIETTIPSLIAARPSRDIRILYRQEITKDFWENWRKKKMKNLYEDPIEEVYRIRQEILAKYGGIEGWNKHLDEVRPKQEAMGAKFLTEAEF